MIYSRISKTDPARREKLEDHVRKVAELCSQDGRWFGASSLGHLIGLVHDVGKASYSWQHYLLSSEQEEKIPHAPVGAKMLYQIADEVSVDKWGKYAVEIVALVVWGHHSGLSDVIMPDATSAYKARLAEPLDTDQKIAVERYFRQVVPKEEIVELMRASGDEHAGIRRLDDHVLLMEERVMLVGLAIGDEELAVR